MLELVIMLEARELYPKVVEVEKDGYKAEARFLKLAPRFMHGFAQEGDPLGVVSLEGPDVRVRVGLDIPLISRLPFCEGLLVNLSKDGLGPSSAREKLAGVLEGKYNREVNWPLFNEVVDQVLHPY